MIINKIFNIYSPKLVFTTISLQPNLTFLFSYRMCLA